jgi:hypothetical protein
MVWTVAAKLAASQEGLSSVSKYVGIYLRELAEIVIGCFLNISIIR